METDESRESGQPQERIRTPLTYKVCEGLIEALIYLSVIFTPWAFGTTQNWSVWTMNVVGYVVGGTFTAKWLIRWWTGYTPSRWEEARQAGGIRIEDAGQKTARYLTTCLAGLNVILLAFCLVSTWNARATFLPFENRFEYHDYIAWLPHSYDRVGTLNAFWQYLGLSFFFWATWDWLLGKTRRERRESGNESRESRVAGQSRFEEQGDLEIELGHAESRLVVPSPVVASGISTLPRARACLLPARLRRLLWVLCINGALLGLEGILQRFDGTNKLLWLVVPRINNSTESQFGPYAYRSNAATYLNLTWPVCLGFWLILRKASTRKRLAAERIGGESYMILLPCAVIMASAPIISTSRGGALIALATLPVASGIVFFAAKRERALVRASMLTLFLVILGFSAYLGWQDLAQRLENMFSDNIGGRMQIYQNSRAIAQQYPVLGTGPASFAAIYQLYKEPQQEWEAYLHDDWLETRITFGLVGFGMILVMLGIVLVRWFISGGIASSWEFVAFIWLAIGGCLVHAKFDFPFQVYSIHFLFLLLCSILFCLSRK